MLNGVQKWEKGQGDNMLFLLNGDSGDLPKVEEPPPPKKSLNIKLYDVKFKLYEIKIPLSNKR